ncbi:SHD1 domain-containing protein [Pontiellaceae bacterium B1224]|nr:SHD1 domain-containing protein [Pontiellaceae bacterium B1224]
MVTRFLIIILLASFLTATHAQSAMRVWTSSTGKTIEAEYIRHVMGKIVLKKADGKTITVSLSYLAKEDQVYAGKLAQSAPKPDASKSKQELRRIVDEYEECLKNKNNSALRGLFDIKSQHDISKWYPPSHVNQVKVKDMDDSSVLVLVKFESYESTNGGKTIETTPRDITGYIYLLDNGKFKYDPLYYWHPVETAFKKISSMSSFCARQKALKEKNNVSPGWGMNLEVLISSGIPTFGLNEEQCAYEQTEELMKCIKWLEENASTWDLGEPKIPLSEDHYKKLSERYQLEKMADKISNY